VRLGKKRNEDFHAGVDEEVAVEEIINTVGEQRSDHPPEVALEPEDGDKDEPGHGHRFQPPGSRPMPKVSLKWHSNRAAMFWCRTEREAHIRHT